jgi:hypothetical protein
MATQTPTCVLYLAFDPRTPRPDGPGVSVDPFGADGVGDHVPVGLVRQPDHQRPAAVLEGTQVLPDDALVAQPRWGQLLVDRQEPRVVPPSRMVNGASVARFEKGFQVAEIRYRPGAKPGERPGRRVRRRARGDVADLGVEALTGEGRSGAGGGEAGGVVVDDLRRGRRVYGPPVEGTRMAPSPLRSVRVVASGPSVPSYCTARYTPSSS